MILAALLALQSPEPMPELSIEAAGPLLPYMACLFAPLEDRPLLPAAANREALAARIIHGCAEVRATAMKQARAALAARPSEPSLAPGTIERFVGHWEDNLRLMVMSPEQFIEVDRRYEECLDRGEDEC